MQSTSLGFEPRSRGLFIVTRTNDAILELAETVEFGRLSRMDPQGISFRHPRVTAIVRESIAGLHPHHETIDLNPQLVD